MSFTINGTLRDELKAAFELANDDFTKMESTLTNEELNKNDYFGIAFTAWGEKNVYFPTEFRDGSESIGYAPRNPCNIKTTAQ